MSMGYCLRPSHCPYRQDEKWERDHPFLCGEDCQGKVKGRDEMKIGLDRPIGPSVAVVDAATEVLRSEL